MMPLCTTATPPGLVRVGVALGRRAVRRPAGMADAGMAADRILHEQVGERDQLADRAAAGEAAVVQRRDAGAVVAAVLEPLQRLEDQRRDLVAAEDARRCRTSGGGLSGRLERAQPLHQPLAEARLRSPAGPRPSASAPAGTSSVMTEPARDQRAVADRDRRHQRRVRADEGARADLGAVLEDAVVVAGDGAGADVGAGADPRVADIGEVVGLGALLDDRVLDLDEVADVRRPRRSRRRAAAARTARSGRRG